MRQLLGLAAAMQVQGPVKLNVKSWRRARGGSACNGKRANLACLFTPAGQERSEPWSSLERSRLIWRWPCKSASSNSDRHLCPARTDSINSFTVSNSWFLRKADLNTELCVGIAEGWTDGKIVYCGIDTLTDLKNSRRVCSTTQRNLAGT
jgi:hypothetical protein